MKQPGFKYALQGIAHSFRSQVSVRVHTFMTSIVVVTGFVLGINAIEWCIILICIGSVFAAEMFNTSIENHINITHPDWNIEVGHAKDVAAGAVLVVSVIAAIIGLIVFTPHLLEKIF